MSMSMCVKALVAYGCRVQNEYQYRFSRIGQFVNSNNDEKMSICRFSIICSNNKKRTRNNDESPVEASIRDRILKQVAESGVDTVLLPLNFMNAHWCCVAIKVQAKRIIYYDLLNQAPYMNAANAIATHLKISGLQEYDVIPQNNRIQFDAYSCGVYVCWMSICQVIPEPPLDMSATSMTRRRFEQLYEVDFSLWKHPH
ncbi:hypothetical protein PC110_g2530 [Phytophthora cactorum]|uniref:Ubiquitin-like protease family profile domain-containing protein n=3 Tax=Phytophthora cactorum TaxID=29920 RepID=A0A329SXC4_9STRA|nr:hypothetical protein PC115_g5701 [Phytophthora cactorum]RAW41310.1 hypothetical protein PC110_g2530 [Phytophthora cactorum]